MKVRPLAAHPARRGSKFLSGPAHTMQKKRISFFIDCPPEGKEMKGGEKGVLTKIETSSDESSLFVPEQQRESTRNVSVAFSVDSKGTGAAGSSALLPRDSSLSPRQINETRRKSSIIGHVDSLILLQQSMQHLTEEEEEEAERKEEEKKTSTPPLPSSSSLPPLSKSSPLAAATGMAVTTATPSLPALSSSQEGGHESVVSSAPNARATRSSAPVFSSLVRPN